MLTANINVIICNCCIRNPVLLVHSVSVRCHIICRDLCLIWIYGLSELSAWFEWPRKMYSIVLQYNILTKQSYEADSRIRYNIVFLFFSQESDCCGCPAFGSPGMTCTLPGQRYSGSVAWLTSIYTAHHLVFVDDHYGVIGNRISKGNPPQSFVGIGNHWPFWFASFPIHVLCSFTQSGNWAESTFLTFESCRISNLVSLVDGVLNGVQGDTQWREIIVKAVNRGLLLSPMGNKTSV